VGTAAYMLKRIRQSKLQIEHAIFWLVFAGILVVLSLFPGLAIWGAKLLGIYSSTNFIFLIIFFLVILKAFFTTIEISNLEYRVKELTQKIAIKERREQDLLQELQKKEREKDEEKD
jgi:hypothetical protein